MYYVYLLVSKFKKRTISYVGYTNNLLKRVHQHNTSKGAKFTKGKKWTVIYKKNFKTKSLALKNEYKLKNDKKKRLLIKNNFVMKLV